MVSEYREVGYRVEGSAAEPCLIVPGFLAGGRRCRMRLVGCGCYVRISMMEGSTVYYPVIRNGGPIAL